jgi:DNA-binding transcriptional LysR family regulator
LFTERDKSREAHMDRIDSMGVFAKVVTKQSFSAAARDLRLSQAAVSKHVRALED